MNDRFKIYIKLDKSSIKKNEKEKRILKT